MIGRQRENGPVLPIAKKNLQKFVLSQSVLRCHQTAQCGFHKWTMSFGKTESLKYLCQEITYA